MAMLTTVPSVPLALLLVQDNTIPYCYCLLTCAPFPSLFTSGVESRKHTNCGVNVETDELFAVYMAATISQQ